MILSEMSRKTIGFIAMKISSDLHVPLRMSPDDVGDPLT